MNIFKKFKISQNLNPSIDFGQIQYQSSLIDVLYLRVFLGRQLKFEEVFRATTVIFQKIQNHIKF